jgi:hypothetical protein
VTQTEDALATAFRTGLPFVGLRDHAHDPDLDRLIPRDAARAARAIPLTADDDRIRLAVADPDTDLSTLDRYLAGRQVDLALAPREEIDTILGPPTETAEATTTEEPELAAAEDVAQTEAPPTADSEPEPEPQPLVGEEATTTEHPPPEPVVAAAESAPQPPDEPVPDAVDAESSREPADAEPAPEAADAGPSRERVAAEAAPEAADAEPAREPVAAEAAPEFASAAAQDERAALPDVDPELAGEVPSWLEPRRRRWWRVVFAVLLVLVVLAVAAVAVVALVNA